MKNFMTILFFLLTVNLFSQADTIMVTLTQQEFAYVYTSLGKRPSEEVESLRTSLRELVKGRTDEQSITLSLKREELAYIADVLSLFPIREAYPAWIKIMQILK